MNLFQAIPSVDVCLNALPPVSDLPHALCRDLVREFLDKLRAQVRSGELTEPSQLARELLLPAMTAFIHEKSKPRLRRVINASGIVVHTNLGRSVLAHSAQTAVTMAASGYCNLEFDLESGRRGSRSALARDMVCRLTGAESALAVNNNAAAVLLMLSSCARGGEVIVSRGQLVEIGGSFRIPEVMEQSGAVLREVGSTNRSHTRDYENAINEHTRALLHVHTSNYRIVGFHSEVELAELSRIAHKRGLPALVDLGSGSFMDFSPWGLPGEPTVQECLARGADVVCFSGDKVLGGPQAGILAGRADLIEAMQHNPLYRALRCDKLTLAALEATLRLYLDPELALREIPTLRGMTQSPVELEQRARKLATMIRRNLKAHADSSEAIPAHVQVVSGVSRVGGGSFPERDLPSRLVRLEPLHIDVDTLRQRLLHGETPLVGRVEDGAYLLDPRTLTEAELKESAALVAGALGVNT